MPRSRLPKATLEAAIHRADGNGKEAVSVLVRMAERDSEIRTTLIRMGADQAIRDYFSDERRSNKKKDSEKRRERDEEQSEEEREEKREEKRERRLFWDRYALFGQLPLKAAKYSDLRDSLKARRAQAAGNLSCAAFEEEIARRLDRHRDRTVEEHFTVDKLMELARVHHVI